MALLAEKDSHVYLGSAQPQQDLWGQKGSCGPLGSEKLQDRDVGTKDKKVKAETREGGPGLWLCWSEHHLPPEGSLVQLPVGTYRRHPAPLSLSVSLSLSKKDSMNISPGEDEHCLGGNGTENSRQSHFLGQGRCEGGAALLVQ